MSSTPQVGQVIAPGSLAAWSHDKAAARLAAPTHAVPTCAVALGSVAPALMP